MQQGFQWLGSTLYYNYNLLLKSLINLSTMNSRSGTAIYKLIDLELRIIFQVKKDEDFTNC